MTVPLSFWCLFWVATTEQREARRFMVSPLGCLVQFTHSGELSLGSLADLTRLGSDHAAVTQLTKAA